MPPLRVFEAHDRITPDDTKRQDRNTVITTATATASNLPAIPAVGEQTALTPSIMTFLGDQPRLHLGGDDGFHVEVFRIHALPPKRRAPIGRVRFALVRGRHGTIPLRLFYPTSWWGTEKHNSNRNNNDRTPRRHLPILVYFHGGGYTVGSVDEFENGLRLIAEKAGIITIGIEYRLAPEDPFPTQLDEYEDIVAWCQGSSSTNTCDKEDRYSEDDTTSAIEYGIDGSKIPSGGDTAGGIMTAAVTLRMLDEGKMPRSRPRSCYTRRLGSPLITPQRGRTIRGSI